MANIITTSGVGSRFVTSALMGMGATAQDPNGRFYVDGSMVNVELSRTIAEAIYIKQIYRDGQSVTGKYTTENVRGGAVRVMLDTALSFASRTVSYGGRQGTEGNGGVINTNPPLLPASEEFIVYMNQVNDQMLEFPDLAKEYLPMEIMAKKIAAYADRVSMDRDASTHAEVIAYAIFRALNGGENLLDNGDLTAENAYANLFNNVNAALDNGDQATGAFTYATEGRTIIGRPKFINGLFNRNSGVILLGGDMAQEMLKNYDLDVSMPARDYVGTGYKGYAMNLHFQSAPDYIWSLAEKYLGLAAGALDNVNAVAVSFESTARADGVDLGVKLVDSNRVRGTLAQPLNIWGHEAFRKSYLIGDATMTTDYFVDLGFSDTVRRHPVAPAIANAEDKISVPIYNSNGDIVGYQQIAAVPKPNGNNIKSGIPSAMSVDASVAPGAVASGTTVALTSGTADATIYYTTDGTEPTSDSQEYSAPIAINAKTTIKAFATKAGLVPSPVSTFSYKIKA